MTWSISKNGATAQTLAQHGLSGVRLTLQSQAPSSLEFIADGVRIDGTKPFAYGDRVEFYADATRRFYGHVRFIFPSSGPEGEGVRYIVMDPWYDLETVPFQQASWGYYDTLGVFQTAYSIRVNLFQDAAGAAINVKQQIEAILTYASTIVSPAIPITTGTIEPTMAWPFTREDNISCANAIRYCLRAAPDCTAYFNYAGSGSPTLHVTRRSSLAATSLNVTAGTSVVASDIKPRYDLLRNYVQITFEYSNVWNNQSFSTRSYDVYPPGTTGQEKDCFAAILSLAGSSVTVESQTLKTATIDVTSPLWWYKNFKALQDRRIGTIFIADGELYQLIEDEEDPDYGEPEMDGANYAAVSFTKHVVEGAVPSWTPSRGRRYVARAWCQYEVLDANGNAVIDPETGEGTVREGWITVNITGTNYASGTYQNTTTNAFAETAPTGIALYLYNALSVLHYEGRVTIAENEVSFAVGMANKINLTGGDPTWSAMAAQVQAIEYDIDFGVTSVTFGPPEHLSPQDLMEQFRATRERLYLFNPETRVNAAPESSSSVTGNFHADNEGPSNANNFEQIVCSDGSADTFAKLSPHNLYITKPTGKKVNVEAGDLPANSEAKFRTVPVCISGVTKYITVLCTDYRVAP